MELMRPSRNIALIEQCAMSTVGIRMLLRDNAFSATQLHCFQHYEECRKTLDSGQYKTVIFSLNGTREHRRECFMSLTELANRFPDTQRVVMANDSVESRLVCQLLSVPLHGVFNKTEPLAHFREGLSLLLSDRGRDSDTQHNHWYLSQTVRMLSPTERRILQFLTDGYSISQIAQHLNRNIKTIRAHKFNAMTKLGVHKDMDLLNAADIVLSRPGAC
ncbi:DNA-binding transcriptional activator BglJ [Entomohabitans teleogrylli]|uniref:DNA-binding transcriptional activator BglJ n=1 Tax=Entomohabitans teleogrylli TaxID=1384589 RepID=UPI00073D97FC|nr:DNA-binding transcriptional activator BglJ [Entomohabitans teleogrylli]